VAELEELRLVVSLTDNASAQLAVIKTALQDIGGGATSGNMDRVKRETSQLTEHLKELIRNLGEGQKAFVGFIRNTSLAGAGLVAVYEGAKLATEMLGKMAGELLRVDQAAKLAGMGTSVYRGLVETFEQAGFSADKAQRNIQALTRATVDFRREFSSDTMQRLLQNVPPAGQRILIAMKEEVLSKNTFAEQAKVIQENLKKLRETIGGEVGLELEQSAYRALGMDPETRFVDFDKAIQRGQEYDQKQREADERRAKIVEREHEAYTKLTQAIDKLIISLSVETMNKFVGGIEHLASAIEHLAHAAEKNQTTWFSIIPGAGVGNALKGSGVGEVQDQEAIKNKLLQRGQERLQQQMPQRLGGGFGEEDAATREYLSRPHELLDRPQSQWSQNIEDARGDPIAAADTVRSEHDRVTLLNRNTAELKRLNDFLQPRPGGAPAGAYGLAGGAAAGSYGLGGAVTTRLSGLARGYGNADGTVTPGPGDGSSSRGPRGGPTGSDVGPGTRGGPSVMPGAAAIVPQGLQRGGLGLGGEGGGGDVPSVAKGPGVGGRITWFNPAPHSYTDPQTGITWTDTSARARGEGPHAGGLPISTPGIAMSGGGQLNHWFEVTMPDGSRHVVQKTDIGPPGVIDFNAAFASKLARTPAEFDKLSGQGRATARYIGPSLPQGVSPGLQTGQQRQAGPGFKELATQPGKPGDLSGLLGGPTPGVAAAGGESKLQPGDSSGVHPELVDVVREASKSLPEGYTARIESGVGNRPGGQRSYHPHGLAADVRIFGPDGKAVGGEKGWYQNPGTFRLYEQFAQAAKAAQVRKYPNGPGFAWGGYFLNGGPGSYGFADLMHMQRGGPMAGGSWEQGATGVTRQWLERGGGTSVGFDPTNPVAMATKSSISLAKLRPADSIDRSMMDIAMAKDITKVNGTGTIDVKVGGGGKGDRLSTRPPYREDSKILDDMPGRMKESNKGEPAGKGTAPEAQPESHDPELDS